MQHSADLFLITLLIPSEETKISVALLGIKVTSEGSFAEEGAWCYVVLIHWTAFPSWMFISMMMLVPAR